MRKKTNASLIKEKVMADVTTDLTDTEIEKFQTLAQDVEYSNEEGYTEKLNTIKESYFPRQKTETQNVDHEVEASPLYRTLQRVPQWTDTSLLLVKLL